tara:strand:+ start:853 stop:1146 length:294 start_codon:yes stop_codon:yes gene_type:complete
MTITKTIEIPNIEIVKDWNIQVATDTVIKEDTVEIGRSRHRHVLVPFASSYNSDTKKWTHTATDISSEASNVQAICNVVWTDTVKANYKTFVESQGV